MFPPPKSRRPSRCAVAAPALLAASLVGGTALPGCAPGTATAPPSSAIERPDASPAAEATREQVAAFCGACHPVPPPETFPRADWPLQVAQGYRFFHDSSLRGTPPPIDGVVSYFKNRAPEALPPLREPSEPGEPRFRFDRLGFGDPRGSRAPAVGHVHFAHLFDDRKLDVLACEMAKGLVLAWKPYEADARPIILSEAVPHPVHAEVVDLDRDGIKDLLVANLGSIDPTDAKVGSVVWLRGSADGKFSAVRLAEGLGRVADVQAADFDGDGDLDLVVAAFGYVVAGEVLYLENRTTDYRRPRFLPATIDPRDGAIHVPVADLDGDGRPDFVALISQEHETVVAFLNDGPSLEGPSLKPGGCRFVPHVLFAAGHPAFGSSGIQLVDLDGDGDRDVLLSNGDSLDTNLLRPYHGIQWLENRGGYPFIPHRLTSMYGVSRALASDLDGDGDLDIVATGFLPGPFQARQIGMDMDSILVMEQVAPGRFVRRSLEKDHPDHATCDLGDFDGDGRPDLVTGNWFIPQGFEGSRSDSEWVVLRRNLGPSPTSEPPPVAGD